MKEGQADGGCVNCDQPITHGCNTAVCSESCENEMAMIHERRHAGISDPDECPGDGDCPLLPSAEAEAMLADPSWHSCPRCGDAFYMMDEDATLCLPCYEAKRYEAHERF